MKNYLKIFLIIIIVIVLAWLAAPYFIAARSQKVLFSEIESSLGVRPQAKSINVSFPATVTIEGFSLGEGIRADKIIYSPSLVGFIRGEMGFNSLVLQKPRLKVTRTADRTFDFGITAAKKEKEGKKKIFYANNLKVEDGDIEFIDTAVSAEQPFKMRLSNLKLDIFRPSIIQLLRMQFIGKGDIVSEKGELAGKVEMAGWVEPLARNMDAKMSLKDARLVYFGPYYKRFLKKELKSGDMVSTADLKSKNNDLKADFHVELTNVAFKEEEAQEGEAEFKPEDLTFLAFDSILASQEKVVFDFSVNTKMTKPKFEKVSFKGTFPGSRIEASFSKPPQETVEEFKKIGKQFEDIGKEFKKAFKKD